MRLLVLKKIDPGHALEMLEIGYLLIMRASVLGRQETIKPSSLAKSLDRQLSANNRRSLRQRCLSLTNQKQTLA